MALRKNFEAEVDTAPTNAGSDAAPDAAPAATTAVAPAATTAVAPPARAFTAALVDLENVIKTEDIATLGPGAFPKITVDLGGFLLDKKDIGQKIRLEVISWNRRWVVSPGVQNAEANELVRFSMDNNVLQNDTRTVKEYLEFLREEGYKDASIKEYYSLWGNLLYANGADVPPVDQKMVEIQLSPQSVSLFKAFQLEYGMKVSRGLLPSTNVLELTSEKKELKTTRFGIMRFAPVL